VFHHLDDRLPGGMDDPSYAAQLITFIVPDGRQTTASPMRRWSPDRFMRAQRSCRLGRSRGRVRWRSAAWLNLARDWVASRRSRRRHARRSCGTFADRCAIEERRVPGDVPEAVECADRRRSGDTAAATWLREVTIPRPSCFGDGPGRGSAEYRHRVTPLDRSSTCSRGERPSSYIHTAGAEALRAKRPRRLFRRPPALTTRGALRLLRRTVRG